MWEEKGSSMIFRMRLKGQNRACMGGLNSTCRCQINLGLNSELTGSKGKLNVVVDLFIIDIYQEN